MSNQAKIDSKYRELRSKIKKKGITSLTLQEQIEWERCSRLTHLNRYESKK